MDMMRRRLAHTIGSLVLTLPLLAWPACPAIAQDVAEVGDQTPEEDVVIDTITVEPGNAEGNGETGEQTGDGAGTGAAEGAEGDEGTGSGGSADQGGDEGDSALTKLFHDDEFPELEGVEVSAPGLETVAVWVGALLVFIAAGAGFGILKGRKDKAARGDGRLPMSKAPTSPEQENNGQAVDKDGDRR